jgi:hypothetical protein
MVPPTIRKALAATFDPAHGFGTGAELEEVGSQLLGMLTPAGLVAKGIIKVSGKTMGVAGKKVAGEIGKKVGMRKGVKTKKFLEDLGKGTALGTGMVAVTPMVGDIDKHLEYYAEGEDVSDLSQIEKYGKVFKEAGKEEAMFGLAFGAAAPILKRGVKLTGKALKAITKMPVGRRLAHWFTATRGTDPEFLGMMVQRDQAVHAAMQRSDGLLKDLERATKKAGNITTEELDRALKGDRSVLMDIGSKSPEVSRILMDMRGNIDIISTKLANNVVGNKHLKEQMGDNVGKYVNKAYQVFEDKQFRDSLAKEIRKKGSSSTHTEVANAVNFIMRSHGVGEGEAKQRLLKLIKSSNTDEALKELNQRYSKGVSSKAFKARKKIPPELRQLYGEEIRDPYSAYARTMAKLSRYQAEHEFMEEAAQHLKSKGLLKEAGEDGGYDLDELMKERVESIFGRGTQAPNPLAGLRVDKNYKDAIINGLDDAFDGAFHADTGLGKGLRTWLRMKGMSQAAKTIYNPATHAANTIGQSAILLANGMIPIGKGASKAGTILAKRLVGRTNTQVGEYLGRLQELGVVDQGLHVSMIKKNLEGMAGNPMEYANRVAKRRGLSKVGAGAKWVNKKVMDIYQAEDDVFKVFHFEKTKDYLKKAFPDKAIDEIEQMAAQRTKDLMPNYSQVSRAVGFMRRMPVGDFITFPAEMIRTTKNLMKYTAKDAMSGNSVLVKEAAKKLAGVTAVAQAPLWMQDMSRNTHGVTAEQENALNATVPNWEAFSPRIYTSSMNTDRHGHKGINYMRLGSLDPYDYFRTAAGAMHQMANSIGTDDGGSFRVEDRPEFNQAVTAMIDNQIMPFLGASMATDAFMLALGGGADNRPVRQADTMAAAFQKIGVPPAGAKVLGSLVDTFTPGFANWIKKKHEFEQSGMRSKSDSTILPTEVNAQGLFGLGSRRFDMSASLPFLLSEHENEGKKALQTMYQDIQDPNMKDPETVYNRYVDGLERSRRSQQQIRAITQAYRDMGFDDNDLATALSIRKGYQGNTMRRLKGMVTAETGQFMPDMISKQAISTAAQKGKDIPLDKMTEYFQQMMNKPLYEY